MKSLLLILTLLISSYTFSQDYPTSFKETFDSLRIAFHKYRSELTYRETVTRKIDTLNLFTIGTASYDNNGRITRYYLKDLKDSISISFDFSCYYCVVNVTTNILNLDSDSVGEYYFGQADLNLTTREIFNLASRYPKLRSYYNYLLLAKKIYKEKNVSN